MTEPQMSFYRVRQMVADIQADGGPQWRPEHLRAALLFTHDAACGWVQICSELTAILDDYEGTEQDEIEDKVARTKEAIADWELANKEDK